MAVDMPTAPAPARALPYLLNRLTQTALNDPTLSSLLTATLNLLVTIHIQPTTTLPLSIPLIPLKVLLHLSSSDPSVLTPQTLLNTLLLYPTHLAAHCTLFTRSLSSDPPLLQMIQSEVLPTLVTQLRLSPTPQLPIHILNLLSTAHEELLALILQEADYILPALRDCWAAGGLKGSYGLRGKTEGLLVVRRLMGVVSSEGGREALKRLLRKGSGVGGKVLVEGETLRWDYEGVFERGVGIPEEELMVLQRFRDEDASIDPRMESLLNLFPALPPHLLLQALNHQSFSSASSTSTPEEQAAPLIDAILSGGETLPDDLAELREAIQRDVVGEQDVPEEAPGDKPERVERKKMERRNIFDDEELDLSRLRLGNDDTKLQIGQTIPDHLRASIMRLVQSQAEEEAAEARALREAQGLPSRERDEWEDYEEGAGVDRLKIGGDGEDSGNEEDGDKVVSRKSSNGVLYDPDQQIKLELAYLSDPAVFGRDSATRRGAARKKLKEITGMDDAQLEGWKIMLERNPHKDAILARHTFTPEKNYLQKLSVEGGDRGSESGPSGSRGRGGGGGGRGRGGGRGGSSAGGDGGSSFGGSSTGGSRGGGSSGRGRGGNKGSRGHSNAARTRGHDKKMTRMGAGASSGV